MQEVRADRGAEGEGEPDDEGGLAHGHQPDAQNLAPEELDRAHRRQQDLNDPARLLLHDADEDPGVVLGEHQEQEHDAEHRRRLRRALRARLERHHRDGLGLVDLGCLGRR